MIVRTMFSTFFIPTFISSLQVLHLASFLIIRMLSHLVSHWFLCCCLSAHNFTQCIPFLTLGLSHCIYSYQKSLGMLGDFIICY
jgi:hypothetical protein